MTSEKTIKIPTGYLFTKNYSRGLLETLSIGDYGKKHNIKADFLGFTRELNGVPNVDIMPLSEKWVITLSTQYGCPMKCQFCDVPEVKFNGNASFDDLYGQFVAARNMFPEVKYVERLNIHFARMGEPAFNYKTVYAFSLWLIENKKFVQDELDLRMETIHPVFTTSMPRKAKDLDRNIMEWTLWIKNHAYRGQAGLQFSINSTNEEQRKEMFNDEVLTLEEISDISKSLPEPIGRKYCLNFALASGYEVDANKLRSLFNPEKFMVKITPIHNNSACAENDIETIDGYESFAPYKEAEDSLKAAGFDVLIFIPSMDEEDGLVTCGNVVLSGSEVKNEVKC